MGAGAAGGYVCGEGFLNGQLTVTRALGDFHPELLAMQRTKERLKYRASDKEPLELTGPLTSGMSECSLHPPLACFSGDAYKYHIHVLYVAHAY